MSDATMPMAEDKTPCEICGKMITTHAGGRKSHMRTHEKKETSEAKPESPKKVAVSDNLKADQKAILERALAAQDNFRKAPEVFLSDDTTDGNMALIELYAPDCLDRFSHEGKLLRKAERHAFFSSVTNLTKWASRGYVPVLSDNGGFVTNEGGDILTSCDLDNYEARERRTQNESRNIVRTVKKDLSKTKVDGVDAGDNDDLRNVSLKVQKEEIQL